MSNGESQPLLGNAGESSSYYFLNTDNKQNGTTPSVRDIDGGEVVEGMPEGARVDEFEPRVLGKVCKKPLIN